MEKKYQVFISSTYTDLKEARTKVRDAILSMYHFPVGMELFGAANEEQWQIIRETIDSSDYYVLIVGQRYGSIIPDGEDAGISYTEKEFRYAIEKGIPILAFLIEDSVPVKPGDVETEHRTEFEAFKNSVMTGRTIERWTNPDDLAQKVTASLYKQITRTKRPGWIRGDAVDIEKSLKAITDLTEKNQQLADENKSLLLENQKLKQADDRKPKLIITIDADVPDDDERENPLYSRKDNISLEDDGEIVHLKVGEVSTSIVEAEYAPVNKSDFVRALYGHVTDEEIKEYNEALPSKEVLDLYLEKYRSYHLIRDHGIAVVATIHNIGTAKATDVSATIEFPEEIKVFDIDKVEDIPEPEPPSKPRDLHEVAYEREYKSEIAMRKALDQLNGFNSLSSLMTPSFPKLTLPGSVYESVDIIDNRVEIETKRGIVHTKFDWFCGIYLVPVKKGEFDVKVTLMCSEYEDPEEMEIKFICE